MTGYRLLLENARNGKVWDIASVTRSVTWETNRTGSPGTLKFSMLKAGDLDFLEGDTVRLEVDGQAQFFGWVFTKSKNRWGEIDVTCYDRLRYLKANAAYAFYDVTAGQMLSQIAADFQLPVSEVADTGYVFSSMLADGQSTCLDLLSDAVQQTLLNTGQLYVLMDDGVGLSLRRPERMISTVVIGDGSLLTDYTYQTDIDKQTYNAVSLAKANEATGRYEVVTVQDSYNIGRFGLLRLFQTIDGDRNTAQMEAQAKATLDYYNHRMKSLKVSALGVPSLRAGQMVLMQVEGLGDINLNQYVLLDRVTHTWENEKHEMELETLDLTEVTG